MLERIGSLLWKADLNTVYMTTAIQKAIINDAEHIEPTFIGYTVQQHSWPGGLCRKDFSLCSLNNKLSSYPFSRLVLQKGAYDGVKGVDVPRLVHKVDSSEPGRKAVLWAIKNTNTLTILPVGMVIHFCCVFAKSIYCFILFKLHYEEGMLDNESGFEHCFVECK